jgi:hypothetical protein
MTYNLWTDYYNMTKEEQEAYNFRVQRMINDVAQPQVTQENFQKFLTKNPNMGTSLLGPFPSKSGGGLLPPTTYEMDDKVYNSDEKPTNPKDLVGSNKVPLGLVPPITQAYLALGHLEGDLKYGRVNWREAGIRTMIYVDACLRHIAKFRDGEWEDPDTTIPHLANALCCLSIILDAHHSGKLIDDRPKSAESAPVIDKLGEKVKFLREKYADKKPTDYFIDGPKERT